MPNDDDPLEDLKAVGLTAGASIARTVETVARNQQNRQTQQAARPEQPEEQWREATPAEVAAQKARQAATERWESQVGQAKQWASPERLKEFEWEVHFGETGSNAARETEKLVAEWKAATGPDGTDAAATPTAAAGYDSPQARDQRAAALITAGVPAEASHAKITADLMNGTDPAGAAASGSKQKVQRGRARQVPQRERGR